MFNKYPYTDFHEMNLDWVINQIQEMKSYIDNNLKEAIKEQVSKILVASIYIPETETLELKITMEE